MIILLKIITQDMFLDILLALWISPGVSFHYQQLVIHGMLLRGFLTSKAYLPIWEFSM